MAGYPILAGTGYGVYLMMTLPTAGLTIAGHDADTEILIGQVRGLPSVRFANNLQMVSGPDDPWDRFASGRRTASVGLNVYFNPELLTQSFGSDADSVKASLFYAFDNGESRRYTLHVRRTGSMDANFEFTAFIHNMEISMLPNDIMQINLTLQADGMPVRHAATVSDRLQELT